MRISFMLVPWQICLLPLDNRSLIGLFSRSFSMAWSPHMIRLSLPSQPQLIMSPTPWMTFMLIFLRLTCALLPNRLLFPLNPRPIWLPPINPLQVDVVFDPTRVVAVEALVFDPTLLPPQSHRSTLLVSF
ncbi:hypothetical protein BVC80_1831g84 [Macleaya cordata]|uniref:Uncharacterized protein n=1 Tax=Macleaya cordata TaxID=56857 RepID=A0A200R781_MACCD|nr:hypothetical protein BVC80_1831g84 [Macleaya cordata]